MATAAATVHVPFKIHRAGDKLKGRFLKCSSTKDDEEVEFDGPDLTVNFEMVDDGGTGLQFPADASQALWVHPVTCKKDPCPPDGAKWSGFQPLRVLAGGKTLQVFNPNGTAEMFKFSLNFFDPAKPSDPLQPWDPIGSNRNGGFVGGTLRSLSTGALLAIGGTFVAAVAAAVLIRPKG